MMQAKLRNEVGSMNVLPNEETLIIGSRIMVEKASSIQSMNSFFPMESSDAGAFSIVMDHDSHEHDVTSVSSHFGSDTGSGTPSMSPINSPGRVELLKSADQFKQRRRRNRFSKLRTSAQWPLTSLDKHLPSVIIEEASPCHKIGEPETPDYDRRTFASAVKTLIIDEEPVGINKLLGHRGLEKQRRRPRFASEQIVEEVVSLDNLFSDDQKNLEKNFSQTIRSWKKKTTEEEGRFGVGSTMATSLASNVLSIHDEKGSREFSRHSNSSNSSTKSFKRSRTGKFNESLERNQENGSYHTHREIYNSIIDDDGLLALNAERGKVRDLKTVGNICSKGN